MDAGFGILLPIMNNYTRLLQVFFGICTMAVICGCNTVRGPQYEDGFVGFDGKVSKVSQGEYYILRFEYPGEFITDNPRWMNGNQRWNFVEVRQLKDGITVVEDGKLRKDNWRKAGLNWQRWLKPGSRNVRIKFVDERYSIADANFDPTPDGFEPLFNGRDLAGWKGVTREENFHMPKVRKAATPEKRKEMQAKADKQMREHWFVRDGVLFFDGLEGGYSLATAKDYRDFELIADWRLLRVLGDSGLYLRGMPQIQIWDPNLWAGIGSGGIYNNATALSNATTCEDRPIGEWNRFRIRMVGNRVSVWLNGVKVVDDVEYENTRDKGEPLPTIEQIELQCHGDPIEFRNLYIKEL